MNLIKSGSISTKYGTKNEYLHAIRTLHDNNIKVLADTVLNHKLGADETEEVMAYEDDPSNRNNEISSALPIQAWTKYYFSARGDTYSNFKWNWTHFHGVDWDENSKRNSVFKFYGKHWDTQVDSENGNFDYLMGADIDLNNMDVVNELTNWGNWYLSFTGVDGFRLDAVKHIRADFFKNWLNDLRISNKKQLFSVGEYWTTNVQTLWDYLLEVDNSMSLFDVPLHYNFYAASCANGDYDMRTILNGTLLQSNPNKAVAFVDNHDTQPRSSIVFLD